MGTTSSTSHTDRPKIYSVSDIHTDEAENWDVIQKHVDERIAALKLSKNKLDESGANVGGNDTDLYYLNQDVLIVAGDVSSKTKVLRQTLTLLKTAFASVFFVNGNNELRLSNKDPTTFQDSVDKYRKIIKMCDDLGVETKPRLIDGAVWIVPLFSWYSPTFDKNFNFDFSFERRWLDFHKCKWPDNLEDKRHEDPDCIGNFFLNLNKDRVKMYDQPVITFSHFLPLPDLVPFYVKNKTLIMVVGHNGLMNQLEIINPIVHVYGHTHINSDRTIGKTRYIQNALGHPHERESMWKVVMDGTRKYEPKLIFDCESVKTRSLSSARVLDDHSELLNTSNEK